MRFPRTLLEFQGQFPDEAHCWAYLRRARWPPGFVCPRCGGRGSHFLVSRRLEQWELGRHGVAERVRVDPTFDPHPCGEPLEM